MTNLPRLLYRQLRSNALLTFTLGAVVGGTFEYYVGSLIERYSFWAPLSILLLFVFAILAYHGLQWLVRRLTRPPVILMGERPQPAQGLILLLGGSSRTTAAKAYEYHCQTLQRVWFIVTDRTKEIADELARQWEPLPTYRQEVDNPFQPGETANAIERAVSHARTLGLSAQTLTCDITGGTTAMTVGALQACLRQRLIMEMTPARYGDDLQAEHAHETIELRFE